MTTPASAEPTEVERNDELDAVLSYIETRTTLSHLVGYAAARGLLADTFFADNIARALAAAVQQERDKYERVADKLDAYYEYLHASAARDWERGDEMGATNLTGQYYATADAARRIREVSR